IVRTQPSHYQAAKNRKNPMVGRVIAISHTPPWLASGWGCRGRRLSRGRRSLGMRPSLWLYRLPLRRRDRGEDALAQPTENSARYRDGPETFRTQSLPLDLDVQADKFDRADKLDTEFPLASVVARPVRREQLLPKISEPGLNCRR